VWPARIARNRDWSVWAYAASGWGTLQEVLAVEELEAELKPDVIIWQMCDNDLFNATPELERALPVYNVGRRRPYLSVDGGVFHAVPTEWPRLRHLVDRHWRFGSLVAARWRERRLPSAPVAEEIADVEHSGLANTLFAEAADRTKMAVSRMRHAVGSTPIIVFASDHRTLTNQVYEVAAQEFGMFWVPDIAQRVDALGRAGRAKDGSHWSPAGHAAVADGLLPKLESVVANVRATAP
jgi:lysophospholipase L1-like esterase